VSVKNGGSELAGGGAGAFRTRDSCEKGPQTWTLFVVLPAGLADLSIRTLGRIPAFVNKKTAPEGAVSL